ncbi:MAG TPA: hypothetical protein VK974_05775 [Methylophilaceae bacterium]|nr:hypothetical protein [Methylophilaceae bacterium]
MSANSIGNTPDSKNNPLADNTANQPKDKDSALTPKVNPFRPDLPFSEKEQSKESPENHTAEW